MGAEQSAPVEEATVTPPWKERMIRPIHDELLETGYMAWADAKKKELNRQPQEPAGLQTQLTEKKEWCRSLLTDRLAVLNLPPVRVAQACLDLAVDIQEINVQLARGNAEKWARG